MNKRDVVKLAIAVGLTAVGFAVPSSNRPLDSILPGIFNSSSNTINVVAGSFTPTTNTPHSAEQVFNAIYNAGSNAIQVNCISGCSSTGLTIGGAISGGATNGVLFENSSGNLAIDAANFSYNSSTQTLYANNFSQGGNSITLGRSGMLGPGFVLGFGGSTPAAGFSFIGEDSTGTYLSYLTADPTVGGNFCIFSTSTSGACPAANTVVTGGNAIALTNKSLGTTEIALNTSGCAKTATSDQISAAGAFATTCSITIPASATAIEVLAAGIYTTTSTSSPLLGMSVTVGSNTPLPATVNLTIQVSQTNRAWQYRGEISLVSSSTSVGVSQVQTNSTTSQQLSSGGTNGTVAITTGSAQTVSINETATMVSGQTFNLQQLIVKIYE
ncbi:MAG TPA: hypothetical protein VGZ29_05720 [Terriglobia bacterium]|nr:hypothetical protein [Terriglobia bacterium]